VASLQEELERIPVEVPFEVLYQEQHTLDLAVATAAVAGVVAVGRILGIHMSFIILTLTLGVKVRTHTDSTPRSF